ncbi:carboxypeptidase-like regulatory domain-containing protein [Engelhardtia mirabilis]|uniref:Nickel uptake substrate-specific transmembrane region n=1 Tax=Engelhardtia mirabilis TaxID=2528011 RepID=A0A518BI27_9BACT|nr:hypothetical protein Pla133_17070 [Planctomycetes bacterium Pla133]QDV00957.1 hypothetical protein Pla86_17060 [Planctomycetes bacterium Pla86]
MIRVPVLLLLAALVSAAVARDGRQDSLDVDVVVLTTDTREEGREPVPGRRVSLSFADEPLAVLVTDEQGVARTRVSIPEHRIGPDSVLRAMVDEPGWQARPRFGQLRAGQRRLVTLRVVALPGVTLQGRVTDADGLPVEGVQVTAVGKAGSLDLGPSAVATAPSRATGGFRLHLAGHRGLELVGYSARLGLAGPVTIAPGASGADLRFGERRPIAGLLTDALGEPLVGLTLVALPAEVPQDLAWLIESGRALDPQREAGLLYGYPLAVTDRDGAFELLAPASDAVQLFTSNPLLGSRLLTDTPLAIDADSFDASLNFCPASIRPVDGQGNWQPTRVDSARPESLDLDASYSLLRIERVASSERTPIGAVEQPDGSVTALLPLGEELVVSFLNADRSVAFARIPAGIEPSLPLELDVPLIAPTGTGTLDLGLAEDVAVPGQVRFRIRHAPSQRIVQEGTFAPRSGTRLELPDASYDVELSPEGFGGGDNWSPSRTHGLWRRLEFEVVTSEITTVRADLPPAGELALGVTLAPIDPGYLTPAGGAQDGHGWFARDLHGHVVLTPLGSSASPLTLELDVARVRLEPEQLTALVAQYESLADALSAEELHELFDWGAALHPQRVTLPPGKYALRVRVPRHLGFTGTVEIRAGEATALRVDLEQNPDPLRDLARF